MQSIRETLLETLARRRNASVLELSRTSGVTKPAVQYHIKQLLAEKKIEHVPSAESYTKRGRPEKIYRLTRRDQPENYDILADFLLRVCQQHIETDLLVAEMAQCLSEPVERELSQNKKGVIQRMGTIIEHLSTLKYAPHWEVHAEGTRVLLRNCPYARLAIQSTIFCKIDQQLLQNLLRFPVQLESAWRDSPETSKGCSFFFSR